MTEKPLASVVVVWHGPIDLIDPCRNPERARSNMHVACPSYHAPVAESVDLFLVSMAVWFLSLKTFFLGIIIISATTGSERPAASAAEAREPLAFRPRVAKNGSATQRCGKIQRSRRGFQSLAEACSRP